MTTLSFSFHTVSKALPPTDLLRKLIWVGGSCTGQPKKELDINRIPSRTIESVAPYVFYNSII